MNGLEEEYGEDVRFLYMDANGNGKEAYEASQFRGHPAVVILKPDGTELWRYQGAPSATELESQIQDALN